MKIVQMCSKDWGGGTQKSRQPKKCICIIDHTHPVLKTKQKSRSTTNDKSLFFHAHNK